jgi:hypothetical protein
VANGAIAVVIHRRRRVRARQREYAAATPPSTLSTLPVLLPDRAGEAKCSTASAMKRRALAVTDHAVSPRHQR